MIILHNFSYLPEQNIKLLYYSTIYELKTSPLSKVILYLIYTSCKCIQFSDTNSLIKGTIMNMLRTKGEVTQLTKKLVQIPSVVNTEGEKLIAKEIHRILSSYSYFKKYPERIIVQQTVDDQVERYNIIAYIIGEKSSINSNKTVVLMGHIDTVGIGDFKEHEELATNPDELIEKLREEKLSGLVGKHVQSDDYMFGRGSLDMKSGVASHLHLLKKYSEQPESFDGNIVCVFECDEEDSSNGILSAVKELHRLRDEHGFNYVAAINADFVAPAYEGDENRYIYKGSVGKLLPSFFITGVETHAGAPFEGIDPNFIASYLTKQISYNPDLCNLGLEEMTLPPVSLKQTDLKPFYDVQTALSAYVYYNFFTHTWNPQEVLTLLKEQAEIAFTEALKDYHERYYKYCQMTDLPYVEKSWKPRVYTYEELNTKLENEYGFKYIKHMTNFKQTLLEDSSLDIRMFAARVVEEAWKWMKDQSPAIVLFYSSLYSPPVDLTGRNEDELRLMQALDAAVSEVQDSYKHPIVTKNYFPFISDMSFVNLCDNELAIGSVIDNNPAWGTKHFINYDEIRKLNIPIINIGPYGHDGHKKYERVEIEYSHYVVPRLTKLVIDKVLSED